MPMQKGTSSLFKKLGTKFVKAVKEHAHDDPKYGRVVDLPPGIKNGVAKLTKLYFDTYKSGNNKGETYLRGEGVVVFPKRVATENGDVGIEGQTTSVMYAVCETKKTLDENVASMLNLLKIMGADKDELEAAGEEDGGIEGIAKALQEATPYFKFTTSPKYDEADKKKEKITGVWENWHGIKGLEDYDPETSDDVDDDTGDKEPAADVEEDEAPKKGKKTTKEPEPEPEAADDEPDLDALAEVADDSDHEDEQKAQKELKKLALSVGITAKWVDDVAKSWTAVAEKIKEKHGEAGDDSDKPVDDDEPEEKKDPEEGDIVKYKGAKDKKALEYEVTAVNEKKKTCDLKQIDDGKTKYLSVKFDAVEISE